MKEILLGMMFGFIEILIFYIGYYFGKYVENKSKPIKMYASFFDGKIIEVFPSKKTVRTMYRNISADLVKIEVRIIK